MPKKNGKPEEELQETDPAKGDPVMIPVPKRNDVLRDLRKVAKPRQKPSAKDGRPSAQS